MGRDEKKTQVRGGEAKLGEEKGKRKRSFFLPGEGYIIGESNAQEWREQT
jgi:hypothetical protein